MVAKGAYFFINNSLNNNYTKMLDIIFKIILLFVAFVLAAIVVYLYIQPV